MAGLWQHEFWFEGARYRLCRASDAKQEPLRPLSGSVAERVLEGLVQAGEVYAVRRAYADFTGATELQHVSTEQIVRWFSAALAGERGPWLVLIRLTVSAPQASTSGAAEDPPAAPSAIRRAPPPPARTDWIEVRFVDDAGQPFARQAYRLTLSDGSVREGSLDAQGRARLDAVPAGTCQVEFPGFVARVAR